MSDSFALCGNCYQISPYNEWKGFNWDDEYEHIVPSNDDPTFSACPKCNYHHIDDDSDPGVWEGSFEQMLFKVIELIADD
jgi:hypothetical protein